MAWSKRVSKCTSEQARKRINFAVKSIGMMYPMVGTEIHMPRQTGKSTIQASMVRLNTVLFNRAARMLGLDRARQLYLARA